MLLPLLLAALAPSFPGAAWSQLEEKQQQEEGKQGQAPFSPTLPLPLQPLHNASFPATDFFAEKAAAAAAEGTKSPGAPTMTATRAAPSSPSSPPPPPRPPSPREEPQPCNISVQRQMLSSLLVRWGPWGFQAQCDLVLFSTGAGGGGGGGSGGSGGARPSFSAAFPRVGPPPLVIEPLGLAAGGFQQDLRLCLGCTWARGRRLGRLRPPSPALFPPSPEAPAPQPPWQQQGERLHFCCLDFSLEELKGDPGWRMNRKPVESTLVACFMTLVIIVWSVAALIWPVPIIAGFLPNGMEPGRGGRAASNANASANAGAAAASSAGNPPPGAAGAAK
ncbi:transmembrane protein 158-like [Sceloporus undulatus]|uniref:transmembrane protein 158-like n=1 Tax=Sceloporus undulatus TaxID=8520 RepID=UPI001C4CFEF5|nr:transmembrane protein 158-like [Sceloporus undulatus]